MFSRATPHGTQALPFPPPPGLPQYFRAGAWVTLRLLLSSTRTFPAGEKCVTPAPSACQPVGTPQLSPGSNPDAPPHMTSLRAKARDCRQQQVAPHCHPWVRGDRTALGTGRRGPWTTSHGSFCNCALNVPTNEVSHSRDTGSELMNCHGLPKLCGWSPGTADQSCVSLSTLLPISQSQWDTTYSFKALCPFATLQLA